MGTRPEPFTFNVPAEAIADLRERLRRTRLPHQAPGEPWAYGANVGYVRQLVDYWRSDFDWRTEEARLNAFPQYKVPLRGIDVHFLHVPGKGPMPCPLLLLHGWPGSVYEFMELIPRLTDPAAHGGDASDSLTVIAPSLPGYGFSDHPRTRAMNLQVMAGIFFKLMTEVLGYRRFGAQGGDWGAAITSRLGEVYEPHLYGIHINMVAVGAAEGRRSGERTEAEKVFLGDLERFRQHETGYQWIQGTKPQTLAYALNDSPA